MLRKILTLCTVILFYCQVHQAIAQPYVISDRYLLINAAAGDPLYTTYTAAMERSSLYGDKGYKMNYYDDCGPLSYGSEQGGRFFTTWEVNSVVVDKISDYFKKPQVFVSFPDMALLHYQPWPGIQVSEIFMVYSSHIALVDMTISNKSGKDLQIKLFPVLEGADSLNVKRFDDSHSAYILHHYETKKRLISNLYDKAPYPTQLNDVFCGDFEPYTYGAYKGNMQDFYNTIKTDFYADKRTDSLNMQSTGPADFAALQAKFELDAGEVKHFRYFRGTQDEKLNLDSLLSEIEELKHESLQPYLDDNVRLFSHIPRIKFRTKAEKIIYLSAFNLVRGCMLPPSGETSHNFYVFSREPLWGWGHGHQVMHESLSMLAYAYLDPLSAENSQRVYMEQQGADGLIAYRHGPRGAQTYPHKGQPTTSAPFFSWTNWEVYKVSKDKEFLEEAYKSGVKYTDWLLKNRDSNKDGTLEWGPYGIIENVRDWYNAVFQVSAERYLDVDKEDISDELECLDLSLMAVNEMRSLSKMAAELGLKKDEIKWKEKADKMSTLINRRMWDKSSGFFYSVNKTDYSFRFMSRDLRRKEIIGFLPMWAEAVSPQRADTLIKSLTDPDEFWREYGIPTLSAKDPWYSPYVDYCCKWNGPVWLLWDYMIFDGLVKYGHNDLALEVADKMILAVQAQLSKNHNYWESYSPDNEVLNCPPNYIWDAIMAKLLIESYKIREHTPSSE